MRLFLKLLVGLAVDVIWGIGLHKTVGISLTGAVGFIIPPLISLLPSGEFINQFLILAGIYFLYDEGWQQVLTDYFAN